MDQLAEFRAASEANDLDRFIATLAPDAELVSPLLAHGVIRGHKDLRLLFDAVYGALEGCAGPSRSGMATVPG